MIIVVLLIGFIIGFCIGEPLGWACGTRWKPEEPESPWKVPTSLEEFHKKP